MIDWAAKGQALTKAELTAQIVPHFLSFIIFIFQTIQRHGHVRRRQAI